MMHGSNMGILPYGLILLWLHGGFCFIQQSYNYPLIRPIGHIKTWDQRESVAKARLKHRYPLSIAQNITEGLFFLKNEEFITL